MTYTLNPKLPEPSLCEVQVRVEVISLGYWVLQCVVAICTLSFLHYPPQN